MYPPRSSVLDQSFAQFHTVNFVKDVAATLYTRFNFLDLDIHPQALTYVTTVARERGIPQLFRLHKCIYDFYHVWLSPVVGRCSLVVLFILGTYSTVS